MKQQPDGFYSLVLKSIYVVLFLSLAITVPVFGEDDNETCLSCHAEQDLTGFDKAGVEVSMYVNGEDLAVSVHAGMSCVDCHADLAGADDYPHAETLQPVDCSTCHDDISAIYVTSAHGMATSNTKAPSCSSCHDKHKILSHTNTAATTSKKNLPYTCSNCHHQQVLTEDPDVKITDSFDRYMRGIHAEGIAKGIGSAASCDDCHGIHDLRRASDSRSKVNKMNIPQTCATCHNDIYIQYSRGIHGKALAAGILDSPNCSDCHGEHEILQISDPNSPVNATNLSDFVCGKCHNNPQLVEKFGLGKDRFTSYQDTYHGLAISGGSIKAANCASCHKAHDILPASNPASSINPDNLTATCQKCHIDANYSFASSYTHKTALTQYEGINKAVAYIYIIAIVLIIGGMLAHNLIILGRFLYEKNKLIKAQPSVKRFNGNMVFQHLVVTVTFILLVITGFALRYPDAWWVKIMNYVGIFESTRGVLHRIAAIGLCYISIHHGLYVILTRAGRKQLMAIAPAKLDLVQVKQNLLSHMGLSEVRPKFGYYDYTRKAEYWALVWGTIVMVVTGLVLWYPTFYTSFLPAWVVTISETIHFYEAWLATLAIAVFHFFFVMFHPEQYPMSFTWINGKMTVNEIEHHHPGWYEELKKEGLKEVVSEEGSKDQPSSTPKI